MYFCIDGFDNVVVVGSKRFKIKNFGFELSVTVESGTLALHWCRSTDRFWSIDLPWRPQLVDVVCEPVDFFYAVDKKWNAKEITVYEISELFVPWFLRRSPILYKLFTWKNSTAIGFDRRGKVTHRRVSTVEAWLRRNNLERINHAKPRVRLQTDPSPTS